MALQNTEKNMDNVFLENKNFKSLSAFLGER